jgi:hypothetical protein
MRPFIIAGLCALLTTPAVAQGSGYYGYGPRAAAHEEWYRAHRAEDIAHWRAMHGDWEGARRAQYWAERHREIARDSSYGWRRW